VSSCRERDLGARAAVAPQLERPLQLVPHERTHDGETRTWAGLARAGALVGNREQDGSVVARELDVDVAGAVLERVLQ